MLTASLGGGSKTVRMLSHIAAAGWVNYLRVLQIPVDINLKSPAAKRTHRKHSLLL